MLVQTFQPMAVQLSVDSCTAIEWKNWGSMTSNQWHNDLNAVHLYQAIYFIEL